MKTGAVRIITQSEKNAIAKGIKGKIDAWARDTLARERKAAGKMRV